MTKREVLEMMLADESVNEIFKEYAKHELELLAKKSSRSKKSDEQLVELENQITEVLGKSDGMTVTEVTKQFDNLSSQKTTSVLNRMVKDGTVMKIKDKKRSLYSLAK